MADDDAREQDHEDPEIADPVEEVAAAIVERFPGSVAFDSHGQSVVYVERAVFADVAGLLRDDQQFTMCLDVTAVDHLLTGARHRPPGVDV